MLLLGVQFSQESPSLVELCIEKGRSGVLLSATPCRCEKLARLEIGKPPPFAGYLSSCRTNTFCSVQAVPLYSGGTGSSEWRSCKVAALGRSSVMRPIRCLVSA